MKRGRIRTELIFIYLITTDIKKAEFCKKCKISEKMLDSIMSGYIPKNIYIINRIADVICVRPHQMFELKD